jgi:Rod binding domain-containing protein
MPIQSAGQLGPGATKKQIEKAVAGFESVLMREWLRQVRSTSLSGEDHAAGGGYLEMADDQMAAFISRQGGMGLTRQLADQLLHQVQAASLIAGGDTSVKSADMKEVAGE